MLQYQSRITSEFSTEIFVPEDNYITNWRRNMAKKWIIDKKSPTLQFPKC